MTILDVNKVSEIRNNLNEDNYQKMITLNLGYENLNLDYLGYDEKVVKLVTSDFIRINKIMPIYEKENKFMVVTGDAFNIKAIDTLKALLDKDIEIIVSSNEKIQKINNIIHNKIKNIDYTNMDELNENEKFKYEIDVLNTPVVKLVEGILVESITKGASDIHIEPFEKNVIIRYRIDGILHNGLDVAISLYSSLSARIKVLSGMNISERRKPQDGRIKRNINDREYDFRVSTLPTIYGEKIVIRILDKEGNKFEIDEIGFDDEILIDIKNLLKMPHGIILVTGPTGCGKTTTLYSFLDYLNNEGINIITVEDPVEYTINGINQVQINPKIEYTFANVLRSVLRQDPNIIMIGEIRDEETAKLAVRLAITGHLVLSTLHTNDSFGAISRLEDLDVEKYFIGEALNGVIAQRLVRKLCNHCKESYIINKDEKIILGIEEDITIYKSKGCRICDNTGYKGRINVHELLLINKEIRESICKGYNSEKIRNKKNKEEMRSIIDCCKEKVMEGSTSIEELLKLMNENSNHNR